LQRLVSNVLPQLQLVGHLRVGCLSSRVDPVDLRDEAIHFFLDSDVFAGGGSIVVSMARARLSF
jgi:hypothetical protein